MRSDRSIQDGVTAAVPREPKQVLVVLKSLNMRKGKMCSQAAHGAVGAVVKGAVHDPVKRTLTIDLSDPAFEEWLIYGRFKKITVSVDSEAALLALRDRAALAGLRHVLITDSGRTEFKGFPTHTVLALGPAWPEEIDPLTRDLPLI